MSALAQLAQRLFANQLQTRAQQNLPVIPNNGNPGGVHNMPPLPQEGGGGMAGMPQPPAMGQPPLPTGQPPTPMPKPMMTGGPGQQQHFYPWMNPSQSMLAMRQRLDEMDQMGRRNPYAMPMRR